MNLAHPDEIVMGAAAVLKILMWTDVRLTLTVYLSKMGAITVLGYFDLWDHLVFIGLLGGLLYGKRFRERYSAQARRQSKVPPRKFGTHNPALIKMGVSAGWLAVWVVNEALCLLTWQRKLYSAVALAGLLLLALLACFVPFWFFLNGLVSAVFLVIGPIIGYPVLNAYAWPAHCEQMYYRRQLPRPYLGKLRITIHQAHGLRLSDFISNDPYVVVLIGEQMQRTKPRKNCADPVWNETLEFFVYSPDCDVQLWMWDWDKSSGDDFMGEATFHTSGRTKQDNLWINVRGRSSMPLDYHLFFFGRTKVSWSLEEVNISPDMFK